MKIKMNSLNSKKMKTRKDQLRLRAQALSL